MSIYVYHYLVYLLCIIYNIYIYTLLNIIYIHYSIYQPRIHTGSGPKKKKKTQLTIPVPPPVWPSSAHFLPRPAMFAPKKSVVNPGNQKSE